jgi:hypothetical protein
MQLRLVATSVGGVTDGPKLVVLRPAPPVDVNDDPNMDWTAKGGKPQAELRIYVSHPDYLNDFVQGSVYDIDVATGDDLARTDNLDKPADEAFKAATTPPPPTPPAPTIPPSTQAPVVNQTPATPTAGTASGATPGGSAPTT